MCSVFTTRQRDARAPSRKGAKQPALPQRPLEEGPFKPGTPFSRAEIEYILRRHGELSAEGGRKYQIVRVLAAEMGRGADSISETIRRLGKEGALGPDAHKRNKHPFSASEKEIIIRTRAEMDEEGKTDVEISEFLADKLGRARASMWGKLQQMIRDGELEKKRALMRVRRRRSQSAASRWNRPKGEPSGSEKPPEPPLRPPAPQKKRLRTFGDGPQRPELRAATAISPEIAALLAKAQSIQKDRFVPFDSACIPKERLENVMEFVKSGIEKEGRLSRRMVGNDFEYRFALAGSLKIDVESRGSQIFFRKGDIPALIFIATMETGTDEEILGQIRALRSELEENMPLFPNSFPSWLELKLWAAREFHLDNDLSGRHATASIRIGNSIDFKGFRKFFEMTMDRHA